MIQKDNKWWYWGKGKGTHTCCDCGLVHDVIMQVTKDKMIKTKWTRNEEATKLERERQAEK